MLCRAVSQLTHEGVMAAAAKCDVSKKHEVDQLVAWTVQTYGALDILIANAGIVKVCAPQVLHDHHQVKVLAMPVTVVAVPVHHKRGKHLPNPSSTLANDQQLSKWPCRSTKKVPERVWLARPLPQWDCRTCQQLPDGDCWGTGPVFQESDKAAAAKSKI